MSSDKNGNAAYYGYAAAPQNGANGTPGSAPRPASSSYTNGGSSSTTTNGGGGAYSSGAYAPQSSYSAASPASPYPNIYSPSNTANSGSATKSGVGLRRRQGAGVHSTFGSSSSSSSAFQSATPSKSMVKRMDFMFPKVDQEYTERRKGRGIPPVVSYILILILVTAETVTWMSQNGAEVEHISVDTTIGRRMRVNLNITFPALACEDLHLDAIDVAGDSQLDIEDTLIKRRLHRDGRPFSSDEIKVDMNFHREQQDKKQRLLKEGLPENYCGPCYGAQEKDDQCCQTCDDVIAAYNTKKWKTDLLKFTAEQCVREGRDKEEPKKIIQGQGCNLSGYMTVNRVSGNFHIAMGEGIERDGRHIHVFSPEDSPNYNSSHIIHQLAFGPEEGNEALNGVTKIVTDESGTTGLFQYFIKLVPTAYVGKDAFPTLKEDVESLPSLYEEGYEVEHEEPTVETNRYFFTERYRPLMTELLEEKHYERDNRRQAAAHAGHAGGHGNHEHHRVQNSVLPGVFFIYEIYPFSVEISKSYVPLTHLLVRLMATIGGVFTVMRWLDSCITGR
mmetsp:Transcript_23773/g.67209  ORF Transcript_23773/g.67209 Transcript_23773/m.67209 type:complete len:560 (+) Transcript_23773:358-2037(+)|eukprot:CAMPEP_0119568574 /NCGR_PEP_ID=MMETSP1352-20130426/39271_1 /TAXON_ID=265584 /ORGANISM="Stauroneis constricta, Strain CCMP1120" /LENGTH=559 /DNA_ID=CAMNT_0007617997 /DNA_START=312 /DNA_END=1991 /DNA_ORIENTATION=-